MIMIKNKILKLISILGYSLTRVQGLDNNVKFWGGLSKEPIRRLVHYEKFMETTDLNGCIVECGVATGDTLIFIKSLQRVKNDKRKVWAFDSYCGFPKGSKNDSKAFLEKGKPGYVKYTLNYVKNNLKTIS